MLELRLAPGLGFYPHSLLTQWGGWISTPPLDHHSNRSPLTSLQNTVTPRTELSRFIFDFSKEVLQGRVAVKQGHIKSSNAQTHNHGTRRTTRSRTWPRRQIQEIHTRRHVSPYPTPRLSANSMQVVSISQRISDPSTPMETKSPKKTPTHPLLKKSRIPKKSLHLKRKMPTSPL